MRQIALTLIFLSLVMLGSAKAQEWPADGLLSTEHVYASFIGAISDAVGVPTDAQPPYWLSLSVVGTVVHEKDPVAAINIANFIPPASSELVVDFDRRIDTLYDVILNSIAFPQLTEDEKKKLAEVEKLLFEHDANGEMIEKDGANVRTNRYEKYIVTGREIRDLEDAQKFAKSGTPDYLRIRSELRKKRQDIDDLRRGQFIKALETADQLEFKDGSRQNQMRRADIQRYRDENEIVPTVPKSFLSPPPDTWAEEAGWADFKYDANTAKDHYDKHTKRIRGSGGLRLGFLSIGGSGEKWERSESKINTVSNFSYSFSVKRVIIFRPWFDARLFDNPNKWTWRKPASLPGEFPLVAKEVGNEGIPIETDGKYEGDEISLAMIPVQLVIGKDMSVSATVSKEEFAEIEKSVTGSGGASLFGVFSLGGGVDTYDLTSDRKADRVDFTIKSKGISVIATISRILPECPNPNPTLSFDWNEAWRRPEQP